MKIFKYVSLLILVCSVSLAQGQLLSKKELRKKKLYKSLEEALKEPEKVYRLELKAKTPQPLSKEIAKLKKLQYLDLSFQKFNKIPDEIGQLKDLQVLSCMLNPLEEFPMGILKLKNLKSLNIGGMESKISAIPEGISALQNLEELFIGTGCCAAPKNIRSLPEGLFELKKLKVLHFSYMMIDKIPAGIGKLTNLRYFVAHQMSRMKFVSPEIFKLNKLEHLHLGSHASNKNFKAIEKGWGKLKSLQILRLSGIFDDKFPVEIGNITQLQALSFINNDNVKVIPAAIGKLVNLELLDLSRNKVEKVSQAIAKLKKLKDLRLWNNKLLEAKQAEIKKWLPNAEITFDR